MTGSQRGIGLETAKVLAAAGAKVVLADLPGTPIEESAARVGGDAVGRAVDIADEASVKG